MFNYRFFSDLESFETTFNEFLKRLYWYKRIDLIKNFATI